MKSILQICLFAIIFLAFACKKDPTPTTYSVVGVWNMSDMYCDDGTISETIDSITRNFTFKIESKEFNSMITILEDSTYSATGSHREFSTET